jgi:hypothetical protein
LLAAALITVFTVVLTFVLHRLRRREHHREPRMA